MIVSYFVIYLLLQVVHTESYRFVSNSKVLPYSSRSLTTIQTISKSFEDQMISTRPRVKIGEKISTLKNSDSDLNRKNGQSTGSQRSYSSSDNKNNQIIMIRSDVVKPWSLADAYNSTTMKTLISLQEDLSSTLTKVERTLVTWLAMLISKIDRDIRTTAASSDYIKRRVAKDTTTLISGFDSTIIRPIMLLPSTVSEVTKDASNWNMIRQGVNPMDSPRLLTNFEATSTKQRAKKVKSTKTKEKSIGVDTIYSSVKTLPSKLKYDYDRRVISRELSKDSAYGRNRLQKQLSSKSKISITDTESDADIAVKEKRVVKNLPISEDTNTMKSKNIVLGVESDGHIMIDSNMATNTFHSNVLSKDIENISQWKDEFLWIAREVVALEVLNKFEKMKQMAQMAQEVKDRMSSDVNNDQTFRYLEEAKISFELVKSDMEALASSSNICDQIVTILSSSMSGWNEVDISSKNILLSGLQTVSAYENKLQTRASEYPSLYQFVSTIISQLQWDLDQSVPNSSLTSSTASTFISSSDSSSLSIQFNRKIGVETKEEEEGEIYETTAESFETEDKRFQKIALKTIDVSLFLLETTIKSIASLVQDQGGQVWERINQAYCIDESIALTNHRIERGVSMVLYRGRKNRQRPRRVIGSWKLIGRLKGSDL